MRTIFLYILHGKVFSILCSTQEIYVKLIWSWSTVFFCIFSFSFSLQSVFFLFLFSLALLFRSSRISIKLCVTLSRISVSASCQLRTADSVLRTTETSLMELELLLEPQLGRAAVNIGWTQNFSLVFYAWRFCLMAGLAAELGLRAEQMLARWIMHFYPQFSQSAGKFNMQLRLAKVVPVRRARLPALVPLLFRSENLIMSRAWVRLLMQIVNSFSFFFFFLICFRLLFI